MKDEIFGTLEYSYTKGFHDSRIINFYLDHHLQTLSKIRADNRVAILYSYTTDEGMILRVNTELPSDIKKTDYPKLSYSSTNKHGKIKVWYNVEQDYYEYLMLPPEIAGEQIRLRITDVKDGFISFKAGSKRTEEQVALIILTNSLAVVENPDKVRKIIFDLKNGKSLEEITKTEY